MYKNLICRHDIQYHIFLHSYMVPEGYCKLKKCNTVHFVHRALDYTDNSIFLPVKKPAE